MLDLLLDSLLDSLKILPVVFLVYVLIEFIESRGARKDKLKKIFGSKLSPLFGAGIGVIPQCGFSVVATGFFNDGYIMAGTLIAVFIATSDEALPIMISRAIENPSLLGGVALLIGVKIAYAALVGFLVNALFSKKLKPIEQAEISEDEADGCCHHSVTEERDGIKELLVHPLIHSLKIFLYVFVVSLLFGWLIEFVIGEETLEAFLTASVWFQPFVSSLVGLIPSCASSVLITELYCDGLLTFGGALAGLAANSGIGLAVLFKASKDKQKAVLISAATLFFSLLLGYVATALGCLL